MKKPNFTLIGNPFFSETPCYSEQIENKRNADMRKKIQDGINKTNQTM